MERIVWHRYFKWLALIVVAFAFVLFIQKALPFIMLPGLGSVIVKMGYADSFANGPLLNFYANDFGIPKPAAISFGLSGAWPAGFMVRLGLHPADAYVGVAALYLGLAMFSAYQIARLFGVTRSTALVGAVAWMSMPIIWAHAGYSTLSWGIALLPFYFLATINLFQIGSETVGKVPITIFIYFITTIISVFMDGYTFMMFASGSSILLLYIFATRSKTRTGLLKVAIPMHIASFTLAYVLYSTFVGKSNFETQPIDFFRGWGLDLSFLAIPTKTVLWLPDLMGISLKRSSELYFGDGSVWQTTFAFPVLLLGLVGWWRARSHVQIATGILLVTLFSFYMALGPSLKINSTKPESLQLSHPRQQSRSMSAELAVAPTGSAWISETLPGFNAMRASYRWSALGIFGLWLLIMLSASHLDKFNQRLWVLGLFVIILLNLPDPKKHWQEGVDNREMIDQIDKDLVSELRQYIKLNETVIFAPWGNDIIVNYLAPRAGFRTFNIGGDKNLQAARSDWPPKMLVMGDEIDPCRSLIAVKMLIDGSADVLVIPYYHMNLSSYLWPCPDQTTARLTEERREALRSIPGFICPKEKRAELQPVIVGLRDLPHIEVKETELFATVRLGPNFSLDDIFNSIQYPIVFGQEFPKNSWLLQEGWHGMEVNHVWSQSSAKMMLPVPKDCETKDCGAVLHFGVFGASSKRPVSITLKSSEPGWKWAQELLTESGDMIELRVPLTGAKGQRSLIISVPESTSPQLLGDSSDPRVLGISLQRIELVQH